MRIQRTDTEHTNGRRLRAVAAIAIASMLAVGGAYAAPRVASPHWRAQGLDRAYPMLTQQAVAACVGQWAGTYAAMRDEWPSQADVQRAAQRCVIVLYQADRAVAGELIGIRTKQYGPPGE